jgi:predicted aspartyl protease
MNDASLRAFSVRSASGLSSRLASRCVVTGVFNPRLRGVVYESREVCALWDTGATHTAISESLALELGLPLTGRTTTGTAGGDVVAGCYTVNLTLPGGIELLNLPVLGLALPSSEMLIGMDVITLGDLAVNQSDGNTRFTFQLPSTHNTDYDIELRDCLARL